MAKEAYDVNKMPKKNPLSLQIDLQKFEKATDEEKHQAEVMSESTSFFRDGMRKLRRNPLAMFSIVVLILIILMITIVPIVVPYSYSDIITVNGKRDKSATNMAPFTYSKSVGPDRFPGRGADLYHRRTGCGICTEHHEP